MTTVDAPSGEVRRPPGTERPRRWRPHLRYELIGCGLHGHELLGVDVAKLRPEDAVVVREDADGLRWYRCLRCDSWLPLEPPAHPVRDYLPPHDQIELPLRGKALRDRYVLRLIAIDRIFHFLVLGVIAGALLWFAHDRSRLDAYWLRITRDLQGGLGGPVRDSGHGLVGEVDKLFNASPTHLVELGAIVAAYALLELVEAIGLWFAKRWAEYLTFIATAVLLAPEIYELAHRVTVLKVIAFVINVAVVVYLLVAKRLFGLRGGAAADRREREADSGWDAMRRTLPTGHRATPVASESATHH